MMRLKRLTKGQASYRKLTAVVLAAAMVLVGLSSPASAEPQGFIEDEIGVGFFYGTFGESPNITLLVGGTAEDFCKNNPEDPFNAEPGMAPLRVFLRNSGAVDLKVNDKYQPIYLYSTDTDNGPQWITDVCNGVVEPELFAEGTADLKVRISIKSENLVDVFNSVNGKATGTDGRQYKVRAYADLIVENGEPVGNPADFVGFKLTEIRR